jgi:transglutaminase-like putative cysteine protease
MRLHIDHTTTFTYDEPVSEAYTTLRLKPMDAAGQICLSFALVTEPRSEVTRYTDFRGNDVRYFDVLQPHDRLVFSSASDVLTPDEFVSDGAELSPLEQFDYLMETAYTQRSPGICALGGCCAGANHPHATAMAIMDAVHNALKYERGATDVRTTAGQALDLGKGVCQDYTHLMLAACRHLGLPARYVSGYLYTSSSLGEDAASHAWVDVHLGESGWISLDPTHNSPQTALHVRVAIGRDYADVTPMHGIYTGNATETLSVAVRVFPPAGGF